MDESGARGRLVLQEPGRLRPVHEHRQVAGARPHEPSIERLPHRGSLSLFDTPIGARRNGPRMPTLARTFPYPRPRYTGLLEWITTTDHKKIGVLYLVPTVFFFLAAGLLALAFRP